MNESDLWTEKWMSPLLWISKIANDIGKEIDKNKVQIKDFKEFGVALGKFVADLERIEKFHQYTMPQSIISAVTMAMYFYVLLGVITSQDLEGSITSDTDTVLEIVSRNFYDFPLFQCVKYVLLFAWIQTAYQLQNPFGDDA